MVKYKITPARNVIATNKPINNKAINDNEPKTIFNADFPQHYFILPKKL